jgi:protein SCO1
MFMSHKCSNILILLILLFTALPSTSSAHVEVPTVKDTSAAGAPGEEVGIDERLGAKLPLSLAFRDEAGKKVTLAELINGPTIIVPVYFLCTNVCNYLQSGLASTIPALRGKPGSDYRIISVSIDETETPQIAQRMKRMYLDSMSTPCPADGWRFLTGDLNNIRGLTDAAGYHFQRRGHDFAHPVASIVVSRDGTIVRYLYGTTFLPKDVSLALLEAHEGKVGAGVRRVVEYCFSFDPAARGYQFNLLRVSATVILLCCGSFLGFLLITGRGSRRNVKGKQ